MGLEFLSRVRRTTLWVAALAALVSSTYVSPGFGIGLACGAAWSLLNLVLLQQLIIALTGDGRGSMAATKRAGFALLGMLLLFAGGAFLLTRLPIAGLMTGFLAPFAVMVLKAATLLLLPTALWRRITRDPRIAAPLVLALFAAIWFALPAQHLTGTTAAGAKTAHVSAAHAAAATHESAGEESGPQKFPNFITVLHRAFPEAGWVEFLHHYEAIVFAFIVALVLCLIAAAATRAPQLIPGGLQNAVEMLVEALNDFITGILGAKHAPRFVPFLGSLFLYIWAMNLFGLIPFMDSPTSSLNITVALALTVFLYAQWIGLRGLGVVGYIDHMMGSPRDLTSWLLVPLMLPIHVLGELSKPISLSCRLFGNVFGEDMLLVAFVSLGVTSLSFTHLPIGLPLQLPFLVLALLTGTLQALVFTVLSTIYFLLMLPHHDHEHDGEHRAEEALLEHSPI
jgi:F-type H+-transporting ATPase subunit a